MRDAFLKLFVKARVTLASLKKEDGQDLIEYALVVALVAFAACAGMTSLASGLNSAFTKVSTIVGQYIT